MLGFFQLMINFIWANLQLEIPVDDQLSFRLWHLIFFVIIIAFLIKLIRMNIYNGGGNK